MQTDQAADVKCSPVRLLASYVDEFERWMQTSVRCRKSREADDVRQEIRLAFWELRDTPATPEEARIIFRKLASRFASRSKRQIFRQGALVHDAEGIAENNEKLSAQSESDTVRSLALLNALEQLDDEQRWFIIECKFKERSNVDVAKELGVSDDIVRNRLWRAITELLALLKDEKRYGKKNERGAIIAPLLFNFTDDDCATFWSIWSAEGRLPNYGGPPGPPANPPRSFRWNPRFSLPHGPNLIAAIGGGLGGLAGVGALLFFLLGSPQRSPAVAQLGIRKHFLAESFGNTNMPQGANATNPAESPDSSDFAESLTSPAPSATSSHVNEATNSSPPVDPEEFKLARRKIPRFLPSRKK